MYKRQLLTLSKVIAADPEVSKWLQVVFVENYNVTAAEKPVSYTHLDVYKRQAPVCPAVIPSKPFNQHRLWV